MTAEETYEKIREIISVRTKSEGVRNDDIGILVHHAINYVMYLWAENWGKDAENGSD